MSFDEMMEDTFEPKLGGGPLTPTGELQVRIEALRAAAQILASGQVNGRGNEIDVATLALAERFAQWLETGER